MSTRSQKQRASVQKISSSRQAIDPLRPNTAPDATTPAAKVVSGQIAHPLSAVERLDILTATESISSINRSALVPFDNTKVLYESLIKERSDELCLIAKKVQSGELSEEEAESELLLTALTHSLNMPRHVAHSALPLLKESLSQATVLREGLRTLWIKDK